MRLRDVMVLLTILMSSPLIFQPVRGAPSDPWYANRVVVGFYNNTSTNAFQISSKYNLPIVLEVDAVQFAVFKTPSATAAWKFLDSVKNEPVVKHAEFDALACALGTCGGGGGGGGTSPPDFSIAATPTSITIMAGSSGTSSITLTSLNGYSGTVSLTIAVLPSGLTTSVNPTSVALTSGGSGASTLAVSTTASTPANSYTVQVTGSDGTLSHSVLITITVVTGDFSIAASPSSLTFIAGSSGTSTTTLTSLNGFSGTISLTTNILSGSQTATGAVTASVSPSSLTLASGGSATSILTLSTTSATPSGTYYVYVTGTSGSLSHSVTVSVSVTSDFSIAPNPVSLTIPGSSSGGSFITVTSTGFTGTVGLTATVSPLVSNGPTAGLSPSSVSLSPGFSATSTLAVSTTNTPPGSYPVTVTGTGKDSNTAATISHSVAVTVTVPFPNDPSYGNQWGLPDLNLPQAWKTTAGNRNRIIAVLDSGIWFGHPDLQANLWTAADGSHGWNCVASPQNNNAADDYGHGTLVAGVASAVTNNGIGIAGTAQEQIMSVKVLDNTGSGTDSTVACGINWAVANGATVINMSFGIVGTPPNTQSAVQNAWNNGALLVAAAGNAGVNAVNCPACFDQVIAVSALQQGDTRWVSSNYGSKIELAAPGAGVLTTNWPQNVIAPTPVCPGLSYCSLDGTSLAAPFVSGVAALAWDYNIHLQIQAALPFSNNQIRDALDSYVVDLGPTGRDDQYGFGKPDALALLNNEVSAHSYTLTAQWQFFFSSGTESNAHVTVYDYTTNSSIVNWQTVGNNGITVSITAGHWIYTYFDKYYNDGSNWVYVAIINGGGGALSGWSFQRRGCGAFFTFPMVNAWNQAIYYVAVGGNPFSTLTC